MKTTLSTEGLSDGESRRKESPVLARREIDNFWDAIRISLPWALECCSDTALLQIERSFDTLGPTTLDPIFEEFVGEERNKRSRRKKENGKQRRTNPLPRLWDLLESAQDLTSKRGFAAGLNKEKRKEMIVLLLRQAQAMLNFIKKIECE